MNLLDVQTIGLSQLFKFMFAAADFETMSLLHVLLVIKGIPVGLVTPLTLVWSDVLVIVHVALIRVEV